MSEDTMGHLAYVQKVANEDVAEIMRKESTYKGSWRRNGGAHAWHMIKRKMDRLMTMLAPLTREEQAVLMTIRSMFSGNRMINGEQEAVGEYVNAITRALTGEDIFYALTQGAGEDGTVLAEVRDLRRYLTLVEAKLMQERAVPDVPGRPQPIGIDWTGRTVEYELPTGTGLLTGIVTKDDGAWVYVGEGIVQVRLEKSRCTLTPVPAEDSNKHADRAENPHDIKAGTRVGGVWRIMPFITAELYEKISPDIKKRFILTGKFAHADRAQYTPEVRQTRFSALIPTLPRLAYEALPVSSKEFYEPRTGVENEWQVREQFREFWT